MPPKFVIASTLAIATLCCDLDQTVEAQLFRRRRANLTNNCPGGVCPSPAYTNTRSGLTINNKGGFEGQLPDTYFQSYIARTAAPQTPTLAPPPEPAVVETEVSILTTVAKAEPTFSEAVAKLESLRSELEAAELMVQRAAAAERKRAAIEAARVQAEIRIREIERDAEIESLKASLQQLQSKAANSTSPLQATQVAE